MNEKIEEKLSELDEPVALEADELSQLEEKANRFEELSENLEALRERTEILDDVHRDSVEELRDADDPVVVESARYEELQSQTEQVKGVYAAQLSDQYEAFDSDELTDKFSIEELREKYEDQFGSIEELADSTAAEPRSQDPSEEELSEETSSSEEQLADEVAQKQQEIRAKLDGIGGE
jgi:chromosome segregation ATPase